MIKSLRCRSKTNNYSVSFRAHEKRSIARPGDVEPTIISTKYFDLKSPHIDHNLEKCNQATTHFFTCSCEPYVTAAIFYEETRQITRAMNLEFE